ncbi:MAG: hypothetical protein ABGY42_07905 [bacterium]
MVSSAGFSATIERPQASSVAGLEQRGIVPGCVTRGGGEAGTVAGLLARVVAEWEVGVMSLVSGGGAPGATEGDA